MLPATSSLVLKIALTEKERQLVINLLQEQQLPVSDIDEVGSPGTELEFAL